MHTCAHFCYKMVHCGIWNRCIVGFVRWVYWNIWNMMEEELTEDILYLDHTGELWCPLGENWFCYNRPQCTLNDIMFDDHPSLQQGPFSIYDWARSQPMRDVCDVFSRSLKILAVDRKQAENRGDMVGKGESLDFSCLHFHYWLYGSIFLNRSLIHISFFFSFT